jgi:hypothetical protein
VLNHDIKRGEKFTPRGLIGQLVGYESANIYKIWIPSLHKVVRSTNITFDETSIGAVSLEVENDPPELMEVDLAYPHTSSGGEGVFEEVFETNEPLPSLTEPEPESPLPSGSDDAFDDQIPVVGSTTGPAPLPAPRRGELKLSINDKGSWHCTINLSFMRTISRYNNNEIPLTSSNNRVSLIHPKQGK